MLSILDAIFGDITAEVVYKKANCTFEESAHSLLSEWEGMRDDIESLDSILDGSLIEDLEMDTDLSTSI